MKYFLIIFISLITGSTVVNLGFGKRKSTYVVAGNFVRRIR
jgi:hypothetical protein